MRDKRDVMRLHIKNGIRNLNDIRESYNTYANGGNIYGGPRPGSNQMELAPLQPKPQVVDYSFVPGKYSVKQNPITTNTIFRKNQKKSVDFKPKMTEGDVENFDNSAKEWLNEWYSKRNNIESKYRSNIAINIANKNLMNAGESFADKMGFTAGKYHQLTNEAIYRRGIKNETRIHELTHARDRVSMIFNDGNIGKINNILKEGDFKKGNPSIHKYWDSPLEINARLNQFRYKLGVRPDEIIDQKRLNELIYDANGGSKDKWLNRYNDKTKIRLLNEVAENKHKLPDNFLNNNIT